MASSHIEGESLVFSLSCGRKLGVPLNLRRGPQGASRAASA